MSMRRSSSMTFSFPPFTKAVRWILGIAGGLYLLDLLLRVANQNASFLLRSFFALVPTNAVHGEIWRLVTYAFLPQDIFGFLFNFVIGVWMFGSQLEMDFGTRKFVEFYFWCLIGAGLLTTAVAYTGELGMNPGISILDTNGPVIGIFLAFGMLYPNLEIRLLLPPVGIRAKYLVGIIIFIEIAVALMAAAPRNGAVLHSMPTFGGLLFSFLYIRFIPRGGFRYIFSERYYGVRNAYFRWKRRRAARKFEVYMRGHKREDYFDKYGNYKDPADKKDDKGNGESRGGWVN